MPRKILPAIRRLAPGPEEKEEKREKKMERMVKLADVLAIINAGMFDLRSSHDNIALQEAIRSLPTVDVRKLDTSKKCDVCYDDTAEWYAIPFLYHNEVNEYISNLILCKECFERLLDAVRERRGR